MAWRALTRAVMTSMPVKIKYSRTPALQHGLRLGYPAQIMGTEKCTTRAGASKDSLRKTLFSTRRSFQGGLGGLFQFGYNGIGHMPGRVKSNGA